MGRPSRLQTLRLATSLATEALATAARRPPRPVLVFLTVTRRCNLSCGYCNEYDQVSDPVPLPVLRERIDHLARLRTVLVTLNGGEPLLHPQLAEVVAHVGARGMIAAVNSNAFKLTADHVEALNRAGLYAMQVSVDAVRPNPTTQKALRSLLPKLRLLAERARFRVRLNTVLGAAPPEEALEVARFALAHGFDSKCALRRNPDGTPAPLDAHTRAIYEQIVALEGRRLGILGERFNDALLRDGSVEWKCRAGARFFHVCENGLVHLCGPRMGQPATPLAAYGDAELLRAFATGKPCASRCPVAYAHQVSRLDRFRAQAPAGAAGAGASGPRLPVLP